MTQSPPFISIITVVYNAYKELQRTLHSIINQTFKDYEWIVIDGGSTDGTVDLIKQNEMHIAYWLSEPDEGIYHAMNKGLAVAKGKYVTFLNAGDHYVDDHVLTALVSQISEQDIFYGDIYYAPANEPEKTLYLKAMGFTKENFLSKGTAVLCHQALFVKRSIAPFYNLTYKYKAELNWYFDIIERTPEYSYIHIDKPVVIYYLGGKGYQNFLSNLFDLGKLIITRFGLRTFFKYKYPETIYKKLRYRYPHFFRRFSILKHK